MLRSLHKSLQLKHVLALGLLVRIAMLLFGLWQDSALLVKYTDVDYDVFSDAARFVAAGRSPYERKTYRYSPLLAWALLPNEYLHPAFGKLLFVLADLLIGYLTHNILHSMGHSSALCVLASAMWLLNPISINVSTRGNADSLVGLCVIATLHFLGNGNLTTAALIYGLAVHLKIYPVVYAITLVLLLARSSVPAHSRLTIGSILLNPRHNFSLYFYHLYLTQSSASSVTALVAFLPQAIVVLCVGVCFSDRNTVFFGLFAQTFAFVLFNKVCTVQYFVWYLALLPLCVPALQRQSLKESITLAVVWLASQALWLQSAYELEFLARQVFLRVWLASVLFFVANTWLLMKLMRNVARK